MDDDARRVILARRARFVAAALAGLATSCKASAPEEPDQPSPQVLIEIPEAKSTSEESDAAPPARSDAGVAAPEPTPRPRVCLSPMH